MSRYFTDRTAKYLIIASASLSFLILLAIAVFTLQQGLPAFQEIGIFDFIAGTTWSPGQNQFGILSMIVGSLLVTVVSILIAVPLGIACAILLAEVASKRIRQILRPAVELLVGIPSIVYGLMGMMIVVPLVRMIGGAGFSILAAAIVLAAMVLPTIISIAEDSIRAVPVGYKEGSLALGTTQWQTIWHILVPAARPGLVAGVMLGMGRAIGETMAMIMVIGNSPIIPTSLLSTARTLTGNIAVEITYASGIHESALFATGVVLFILIIVLNSLAMLISKRGVALSNVR
jgi:phosphate transport system permease protein